jgi:hypothetical protein
MFSTDVFTKATSSSTSMKNEQKTRVEIQASFMLESVSDGKQKFSLENLYIILPENIESVQKNNMEFLFKHETKQANDTVTTPVKPIPTKIPSAPVKAPRENCPCISCTFISKLDEKKSFYENELVVLYMKNDDSITYEDFLMKQDSVTLKDKPFHKQINDYLSVKEFEKRDNYNRLRLLQKLFDENKYQWKDEYLNVYKNWSTQFEGAKNMNRYKKMVQFINENRSDFTKII